MNSDTFIDLGKIVSAHGLAGVINYVPFNPASDLPIPGTRVTLRFPDGKTGTALVVSIREKPKMRMITFEGVTDRSAAERLRGAIVACPRSELPDLDDGEFYYSDVIGLPVRFPDGSLVGTVTQVLSLAGDVMEIRSESGDEWMIPIVPGFVRSVSKTGVVIEADALEME